MLPLITKLINYYIQFSYWWSWDVDEVITENSCQSKYFVFNSIESFQKSPFFLNTAISI